MLTVTAVNGSPAGVGATVYFGSAESRRQIQEVSEAFAHAHELGMFTVLWCYLRNSAFKKDGVDYGVAADLTGQANHIGVTIEADIIITATGFDLCVLGDIDITIDGEPLDLSSTVSYRGMLFTGVPSRRSTPMSRMRPISSSRRSSRT